MKKLHSLITTVGLLLAAASAHAQLIITLNSYDISALQGDNVNVSGSIINPGGIGGGPPPSRFFSAPAYFMGGTNISFTGPGSLVTGDATPFYTPSFFYAHDTDGSNPANDGLINAGETLPSFGASADLFTINIDPSADLGTYIGEFDVLDGDGNQLGAANFTVTVSALSAPSSPGTPEPGTVTLLLVGCTLAGARKLRRSVRMRTEVR